MCWEEERSPPKRGGKGVRFERETGWPAGLILAVCLAEFNAFDDTPWVLRLVDYVKDVLAQRRVRLVGVCFGHQIIGRAMGAPVGRSEGGAWEVSVCDVQLTAEGTRVFGGRERLVRYGSGLSFLLLFFSLPFCERFLEWLRGREASWSAVSQFLLILCSRAFFRCTRISSSSTPPAWNRWARRRAVSSRGCMFRTG